MVLDCFLISSGVMLFAGINSFLFSLSGERVRIYISFGTLCLLAASYQFYSYKYYSAANIEEAIQALRLQLSAIYFFYPIFYLFIAYYSKQRRILPLLIVILTISAALFGINTQAPGTVRFVEVQGLQEFSVLGENLVMLDGSQSPNGILMHLFGLILISWGLTRIYVLYRERNWQLTTLFGISIILVILGAIWGAMVDSGKITSIYMAGYCFMMIIIMMSASLMFDIKRQANHLRYKTERLIYEQQERQRHQKAHLMLSKVIYQSPLPHFVTNLEGEVIQTNKSARDFWRNPINGLNLLKLLDEAFTGHDLSIKELPLVGCFSLPDISVTALPKELLLSSESVKWIRFQLMLITNDLGKPEHISILCEDVTERHYFVDSLSQIAKGVSSSTGHQFYEKMVLNLAELFNAKYAFVGLLNEGFTEVTTLSLAANHQIVDNFSYALKGTPCANVVGQSICFYPCNIQELFPDDHLLIDMGIEGYIGAPMFDEQNRPMGLVVILDDKKMSVNETSRNMLEIFAARAGAELRRAEAEKQIRKMAYEDYTTQLPNRALTFDHLSHLLVRLRHEREKAVLYLFDMDNFKSINDALGHDVGDDVLRALGRRLQDYSKGQFFVSRVGGDEFILIQESHVQASMIEELLELTSQPIQVGDHLIDIGASFGVVNFPLSDEGPLDLIRHAELALYRAKQTSRGTYCVYEPELETSAKEQMHIKNALKQALIADELSIYFQPQVKADGSLFGAEVLVRWHDKELGFVSPAKFIPIAEEAGLIHLVGDWVLDHSLSQLNSWLNRGVTFKGHLSINVSAWQFALPNFVDHVKGKVTAAKLDPSLIMLELTETCVLHDVDDTIQKLHRLRQFGIKIALDDFGTGYSSLAYLRDLPIDVLKIDKTFIDELESGGQSPLTESMVAIGQNMGLDVIAEGVEQLEQSQRLEAMGCTIYQGYYYARPMPMAEFEKWLNALD